MFRLILLENYQNQNQYQFGTLGGASTEIIFKVLKILSNGKLFIMQVKRTKLHFHSLIFLNVSRVFIKKIFSFYK